MSSYPSPIAILPIFNSQEFNYSSSSLSISTADKRYLRLTGGIESGLVTFNGGLSTSTIYNGIGTFTVPSSGLGTLATTNNVVDLSSNQTVGGQKSFSNIATFTTTDGIPGGQAFNITSLTPAYSTRLYSVNNSYSTDLYFPQFNGIDTIVSTASIATMTNKDLSSSTNSFPTNRLGYAQITSNFTTTSVSDVQVTGLTTTVTVPSGGRGVKITVYSEALYISLAGQMYSS